MIESDGWETVYATGERLSRITREDFAPVFAGLPPRLIGSTLVHREYTPMALWQSLAPPDDEDDE
jgi:hypothetical protein